MVYHPSKVKEGSNDTGLNIDLVKMTAASVQEANLSPYTPRQIPAHILSTGKSALSEDTVTPELPKPPYWKAGDDQTVSLSLPPKFEAGLYRIGTDDKVRLLVIDSTKKAEGWNTTIEKIMDTQNYSVADDGTISVPTLGRVRIAGMTAKEAEAEVRDQLIKSGKNISIAVEIDEFNSMKITVGGEVKTPGQLTFGPTSLTLGEAISRSGGLSTDAKRSGHISVFRGGQRYQIPMDDYGQRSDVQNLKLAEGDRVVVSSDFDIEQARKNFNDQMHVIETAGKLESYEAEASQRKAIEAQSLREEKRGIYKYLVQIEALERDFAYLIGDVENQMKFTLPFERKASLAEALYDRENGINMRTGNPRQVYVLRKDLASDEDITAWQLDGSNPANLILTTQFELRPNDIVFVAAQPVTNWNRVLTQIQPSLVDTSINSALNN